MINHTVLGRHFSFVSNKMSQTWNKSIWEPGYYLINSTQKTNIAYFPKEKTSGFQARS